MQSRAPRQQIIKSRAPRALISVTALAVASWASSANAAGLGRLEVQSALGQPLQAEVEITALSRDEAGSVSARLAPKDAFRQAGLEYNPVLSGLRFAVEQRSGRSFVKITSVQPINEPFVDLLVELNWATGKFVREYTFLLDPVEVRMARDAAAGVAAPTQGAATSDAGSVTPPSSVVGGPAQAPRSRPSVASSSTESAKPASSSSVAGQIQIKRGDTLGVLASTHQPEGVSLDQAMVAIYQANPQAFAGNVNRLRQGARIVIPTKEAMLGVDSAEAAKLVQLHSSDFSEYRQRLAGTARMVEGPRAGQSAAGAIGAQVEDRAAAVGDQLRLSKPVGGAAAPGASAVGAATARGAVAEQQVASVAALNEARSRIEDLEKNVRDLQGLLELKNKSLADAQAKLDEMRGASPAQGAVAAAPALDGLKPDTLEPPKDLIPPQSELAAPESGGPEAGAMPPPVAEQPAPEVPQDSLKQEAPEPAPMRTAPGMFEDGLGRTLLLSGLGLAGVLGVGYGVYAVRRRRGVKRFEDSLMPVDGLSPNSLFGTTGGQSVDTHDGAFAPSVSASEMHSTEVDPIAEADVYIAYGREAQAEDILKEALKRQPERQAVRAKLLEIYSGRRDVSAFESLARDMHNMTGGRNEEWPRVVTQGLAIDPTNPLYTGVSHAERGHFERASSAEPASVKPPSAASVAAFASATAAATQELRNRAPLERPAVAPVQESSDLDFDPLARPLVNTSSMAPRPESPPPLADFKLPTLEFESSESETDDSGPLRLDLANLERLTQVGIARESVPSHSGAEMEPALAGVDDVSAAVGQSGRWQEMATKLDLAAAYEEIGDKEGARELLQEVITGGDSGQQQRARTMLSKIA